MDRIEEKLTEAERIIYREEKRLNQLFKQACLSSRAETEGAMQELRKVFYASKARIEALQQAAPEARDYKELGRLSSNCKDIVVLFNDMGWGLQERRISPAKGPRYTGLGGNE